MWWRTALVSLFCLVVAPEVQAVDVATYGTGLLPCASYLDARSREDSADQVAFIDWLIGYLSGVNATSTRRNNILGLSDVLGMMQRLDRACRARPEANFAYAAGVLMMNANSTPGAHSVETTRYGAGFKACTTYIASRQPQSFDGDEFVNWLGGYLSGANAISLKTNDVLGTSDLTQAVFWLDDYCTAHPAQPFSLAVTALVDASHDIKVARH